MPRLYVLLFWIITGVLLFAISQNYYQGNPILSSSVYIVMGIMVVLVLCDEITKHLTS